jgi:hypothetical protein
MIKNEPIPGLGGGGGLPFTNGWTIDKLLKGAGVGSAPTELDPYRTFATGWTLGKLLKGGGALADPTEFSGWEVVSEVVVPSAVSYVDFTSLDGNADKFYVLFVNLRNALSSDYVVLLSANGDYTEANYYSQRIYANGDTLSGGRFNSMYLSVLPASGNLAVMLYALRDANGYYRHYTFSTLLVSTAVVIQNWACVKTATITNLTSLRVWCGAAAIGSGSTILLCKPRTA